MSDVETYDPKDIIVIVAGKILTGFSNDKVTVQRVSNQVEDELGADGDVVRRITNDRRGEIVVSLLPTSLSNGVLTLLARADELTGNGIFPVIIKDNRGNDLHTAPVSWIGKMANADYKNSIENRNWTFRSGELAMIVGGTG